MPAHGDRRPGRAGSPATTTRPAATAASRTASRSGASTPPPAPCPRTSRRGGRAGPAGRCRSAPDRAGCRSRCWLRTGPFCAAGPASGANRAADQLSGTRVEQPIAHRRAGVVDGVRSGSTSPRQATSIARRSRGVVPPQTPWQSPTSQRPGQAGALHVAAAAQRDGGVRPARSVPERMSPDRRSGRRRWCARRRPVAVRARPAAVADRAARRRPRAGAAYVPVSSTHLPRGTGKIGGRRPPRADRQPLPALCSIALRNTETRVCREHD